MLHKSSYIILILSFTLLIGVVKSPIYAQGNCNFSIEGYVIDEHDNTPLVSANIYVKETGMGCISDENGYYKIEGLCKGINTIVCSHIGCESITQTFNISQNTEFNFILEHHTHLLESISITAKKINTNTPVSMKIIDKEEIERNVLSDFSEFISSLEGVSTIKSGGNISKPVLHGMSGNRIKIIHNEIGIEDQQWGAEHAPSILLTNSEEIQVIKGAGTVKYGSDAIAGAIVVSPPSIPNDENINGKIFLQAESVNALASLGFNLRSSLKNRGTMGWNIGGQFSSSGDIKTPNYFQSNTGTRNYNYHLSFGQKKANMNYRFDYQHKYNETGILRFAHIGNVTDFIIAVESDTPIIRRPYKYSIDAPRQQTHHHTISGTVNYILKKDINLKALYAYQSNIRREFDIRRAGRSAIPSLDMHLQTHYLDLEMVDFKNEKFKTNAGIQLQNQYNYNNPRTRTSLLIPNFKTYNAGIFVTEEITFEKLTFEFGARYDYQYQNIIINQRIAGEDSSYTDKNNYHNFSLNSGVYWKPNDHFYFKYNIGSAFRNPHVNELYSDGLHHGAAIFERGDNTLDSEVSLNNSLELGLTFPKWSFNANPYYLYFFNYIFKSLNGVVPTIRGAFPLFQYQQSAATILGTDFSLQHTPLKYITMSHNADFVMGWTNKNKHRLPEISPATLSHNIAFNYPLEGKKVTQLHISLGIQTVFKPLNVLNIVRADSLITLSDDALALFSQEKGFIDFTTPPPTYTIVDMEAGFTIKKEKAKIDLIVGTNNLGNKTYRNYLNRFRYFTDEAGINFYIKSIIHIFNQ